MEDRQGRVIALGFFDGVHKGHAALLNRAKELADELDAGPAVLSFDTPPCKSAELICSCNDRMDIMRRIHGIDDIIMLHFDNELRKMPWDEFVVLLRDSFGAVGLVAGDNFRFGYKGAGDVTKLEQKSAELSMACEIVPEVAIDGRRVTSSYIRELIKAGDIVRANEFLGHPWQLTDVVRRGYRIGHKIGIPTVNMMFEPNVQIPAKGVYASRVYPGDGRYYNAVTNVGVRPTFNGDKLTAESHMLDCTGNFYGKTVRVELYAYLRPEKRFPNPEELRLAIEADIAAAREILAAV